MERLEACRRGEDIGPHRDCADIYRVGVLGLLSSLGPRGLQYNVRPVIQALPAYGGENLGKYDLVLRPLENIGTVEVITVLLRDMHEEVFVHEALRLLLSDGAVPSKAAVHEPPLRAMLGLKPVMVNEVTKLDAVEAVLGAPYSPHRKCLIARCETRMKHRFSTDQRDFWLQWRLPAAALHCVPGAGKTTMVLCLAYILAFHVKERDVRLVITEPTKAMCDELRDRLMTFLGDRALVARVGFDEATGDDHWEAFMQERIEERLDIESVALAALDACLDAVITRLRGFSVSQRLTQGQARELLRLACDLLGKRHEYLNNYLYTKELAMRATAAQGVKAFVLTGTNLAKVSSLQKALRAYAPGDGMLWLAKDEHQREKVVPVAASLRGFSVFLGLGDPWQVHCTALHCTVALHRPALHCTTLR